MTRKMIVAVAICLMATAPVASASPLENSLADFGAWIERIVENFAAFAPSADDDSPALTTPDDPPPEGEDEASWAIDPHG